MIKIVLNETSQFDENFPIHASFEVSILNGTAKQEYNFSDSELKAYETPKRCT